MTTYGSRRYYLIKDIKTDMSPDSEFERLVNGVRTMTSYRQYYKDRYGIDIKCK